ADNRGRLLAGCGPGQRGGGGDGGGGRRGDAELRPEADPGAACPPAAHPAVLGQRGDQRGGRVAESGQGLLGEHLLDGRRQRLHDRRLVVGAVEEPFDPVGVGGPEDLGGGEIGRAHV